MLKLFALLGIVMCFVFWPVGLAMIGLAVLGAIFGILGNSRRQVRQLKTLNKTVKSG
jgi:hypothetical protein